MEELKAFHCDRVRKEWDPSVLIGFLCCDEDEGVWDFGRVVGSVLFPRTIFLMHDLRLGL